MELTGCEVVEDVDTVNDTDFDIDAGDVMNCSLTYPSRAYIIVVDQDSTTTTDLIEVADTSYEDWLWYVILGSVVLLALLSYIAYRWWVNKKMKEAQVGQVEDDLEAVIEEQEQGWTGATDANIAPANPLAMVGGTGIQAPVGNTLPSPRTKAAISDVAVVGVEKFNERVEYGQQRGDNNQIEEEDGGAGDATFTED